MPKRIIKRFLPESSKITGHKSLAKLSKYLHEPNLWHFNRRSVAGAFSVGVFSAFIPAPGQMLIAALGAVITRVNLPISVSLVWLTNPLTLAPVFYISYKIGAWLLHYPPLDSDFHYSWEWFSSAFDNIWAPFLFGSIMLGIFGAVFSNIMIRILWRILVSHNWSRRKRLRKLKTQNMNISDKS